ncbi:MAG: hypothetical protein KF724_00800 [Phycisphaeraceae bacterium]|nr:hypothetical protein [Phycisphaeraceae bacterium]
MKRPRTSPSTAPTTLTREERQLLLSLTSLPTAAGREDAVQEALDLWVHSFNGAVQIRRDDVGNALVHSTAGAGRRTASSKTKANAKSRASTGLRMLITAHMDHPAFIVRRALNRHSVELEFRGGVHNPYFSNAELEIFPRGAEQVPCSATIRRLDAKAKPFKLVRAELHDRAIDAREIAEGSIARWKLPRAEISGGLLRTHACDDLAAMGTAMIAFERLVRSGHAEGSGLLFTVAEEVGFLGAIRATRSGLIPRGATLLCLENSRSFAHDSPIGSGAILRVGDRLSVFSPEVTNALTQLYQRHATANPRFRWQRKLMPGGACEATAFAALGHRSTCLCLPLGNYHNMADIDEVLAGRTPASIGREFVALRDIESLVDMLILAARSLASQESDPALGSYKPLIEKIWSERAKGVLKNS